MSESQGVLGRLFSGFWRGLTWLRVSLSNLLFLLVVLLVVIALSGGSPDPVEDNTALLINPVGVVVEERTFRDPVELLLGGNSVAEQEVLFTDILDALAAAAEDPAISAVVMQLDRLRYVGITKSLEIGEAIEAFKLSGKPVLSIGDYMSQDQYLLASYADEVYLNSHGGLFLEGYSSYRSYFKDALEKVKVDVNVFVAGENKDAMEPFLRNDMSDSNRAINLAWLNALWQQYTGAVEQNRSLNPGAIDDYITSYDELSRETNGDYAQMALATGLVDKLLTRTGMMEHLIDIVGASDRESGFRAIEFDRYLGRNGFSGYAASGGDEVGVIVASGVIVDGEQPAGMIGGDTLAGLIRDARADENIAALVLRIDSGGGSAFASEVVRQEILNTRAEGIPVVASMGAVAASGGYWIAMDADQIWAMPTTLTGSIGVWSSIPTVERSLAAVGIHTDGVATTPLAGALRVDRSLAPPVTNILQRHVDHLYSNFVSYVMAGRDMSEAEVAAAAEGRVWSGEKALELGLVDHLGGFDAAIAAAADLAGVPRDAYRFIRQPLSPREQFLQGLAGELAQRGFLPSVETSLLSGYKELMEPVMAAGMLLRQLNDPAGLYARCVVCTPP